MGYPTHMGCVTTASMGPASTGHIPIGQAFSTSLSSTEVSRQDITGIAGTIGGVAISVTGNIGAGASTLKIRVEGADTAIVINIPGNTTGTFKDAHTAAVGAGQKFSAQVNSGSSLDWERITAMFKANDGSSVSILTFITASTAVASTAIYAPIAMQGVLLTANTEAQVQAKFPLAGTLSYMSVYVSGARATDSTLRLRKNGAAGNQVLTLTGGVTGRFTDTTHTDAVATDDLVCYELTTGTGADTITLSTGSMTFQSSTPGSAPLFFIGASQNVVANRRFRPWVLTSTGTASFSAFFARSTILSKLRAYVSANAKVNTATLSSEDSSGNAGALSVNIGAGATGWFSDDVNQHALVAPKMPQALISSADVANTLTTRMMLGMLTTANDSFVPQIVEMQKVA